jgi:hypothetical protein
MSKNWPGLSIPLLVLAFGCSEDGSETGGSGGAVGGDSAIGGGAPSGGVSTGGTEGEGAEGGAAGSGATTVPAGWLYTISDDNHVYLSDGDSGSIWMGRGVNLDDLFLCGYNWDLWMDGPTGEEALLGVLDRLMTDWQPSFLRISLGMNSYSPVVSWLGTSTYKTAMTNVINAIGGYPGTYVLVCLRSDTSMVDADDAVCGQSDDAVCMPTEDTDEVYRALVDSFQDAPHVLFGVANEPGGMSASDQEISTSMAHAVGVIRAREDELGVPHHVVAVQGNQWTSRIGFYDAAPLAYDNVVYEYHAYPPEASGTYSYLQSSIPVIIGEYGPSSGDLSFLDDFYSSVEANYVPNLAWSLSPYSNCAPDLVSLTYSSTLTPNEWGTAVQTYLLAH